MVNAGMSDYLMVLNVSLRGSAAARRNLFLELRQDFLGIRAAGQGLLERSRALDFPAYVSPTTNTNILVRWQKEGLMPGDTTKYHSIYFRWRSRSTTGHLTYEDLQPHLIGLSPTHQKLAYGIECEITALNSQERMLRAWMTELVGQSIRLDELERLQG